MVAGPREGQTVPDNGGEIDRHRAGVTELGAHARRAQHLVDGPHQPAGVLDHDPVELLPRGLVDGPALQGLQVQTNRRDGGLQFVGDGVDERVVLLVPPNLADEKDRVEHDPGDDEREREEAEDQHPRLPAS